MTDAPAPSPDAEDETWSIEVDHSQYYRWVPVKDEDMAEGMVTVEATWPGFHMQRVVVDEPTMSTTGVHIPSLKAENTEREAAGLSRRSDTANLIRHLEDGPWPKHFPLESITAVRCNNATVEAKLAGHFLGGDA